jgi:hypothetical protein
VGVQQLNVVGSDGGKQHPDRPCGAHPRELLQQRRRRLVQTLHVREVKYKKVWPVGHLPRPIRLVAGNIVVARGLLRLVSVGSGRHPSRSFQFDSVGVTPRGRRLLGLKRHNGLL